MAVADQIHELATHLLPILSLLGFKYLKSRRAFQRTTNYGRDIVDLLNSRFHLYFGFGVRHETVQNLLSDWGSGSDSTTATVCQNGLNIHPNRSISYAGPTYWEFSPTFDLTTVAPEASRFVTEVVLLWLEKFGDSTKLREALANADGWVISHRPWEVVVALDVLAGRDEDVPKYLAEQKELARAKKWIPDRVQRLASCSEMFSTRLRERPSDQQMRLTRVEVFAVHGSDDGLVEVLAKLAHRGRLSLLNRVQSGSRSKIEEMTCPRSAPKTSRRG